MRAHPQRFFELQLAFARVMATLTGQPFPEAVLRYTAIYRILGVEGQLEPARPV